MMFSNMVLFLLQAGIALAGDCEQVRAVRTGGQWLLQQHSHRHSVRSLDLAQLTNLANLTPSELMPCPGATLVTTCMTLADYDRVVQAVRGALESLPATCTTSSCPQADWAGCVLRMAGHDFMDFAGQGGSDACTDMSDPDNGGLAACLATGEHGIALVDIYQQFCVDVSLADFLVIAAEAVLASTRDRHIQSNPTAPPLNLRSQFRFGRVTALSCDFSAGLLPNPERGCEAVEDTFVNALGLSWTEAAALMGVHTLGRAQVSNSGYHGWWSDPENSRQFNNNFYISLLAKGWIPELAVGGNSAKNQWERSDIGRDTSFDGHEMMLNTDLCLAYSETGRNGGPVVATEHDCCAWLTSTTIADAVANNGGEYCGGNPGRGERGQCCGDQANDCGDRNDPSGPAAEAVLRFAADEAAWLDTFARAWAIATENGHGELQRLGSCTTEPRTTSTTVTPVSTTTTPSVTSTVTTSTATTAVTTTSTLVFSTTSASTTSESSTTGSTTGGFPLLPGFRVVDGMDRACRGRGDATIVQIPDVEQCQAQCRETRGCRGVSFAAPRCELWAERIQETVSQAGSVCLRFRNRGGKGGRDA